MLGVWPTGSATHSDREHRQGRACRKPVLGDWISYYTFESVATTPAESPSSGLSTVVGLVRSTPLTECRPGPDRRPLKNRYWTEGAAGAEI